MSGGRPASRVSTLRLTWAIFAIAVAVSVVAFLVVDGGSHSVSDTLYGWAPLVTIATVAAAALLLFLGRRS